MNWLRQATYFKVGDKIQLTTTIKQRGWLQERQAGETGVIVDLEEQSFFTGNIVGYKVKWDSDGQEDWLGNAHLLARKAAVNKFFY